MDDRQDSGSGSSSHDAPAGFKPGPGSIFPGFPAPGPQTPPPLPPEARSAASTPASTNLPNPFLSGGLEATPAGQSGYIGSIPIRHTGGFPDVVRQRDSGTVGTPHVPGSLNSSGPGEAGGATRAPADLYAELFGVAAPQRVKKDSTKNGSLEQVQAPPPASPRNLKDSGLTISLVCDLILKQLYLQGSLLGVEIARNARLPFHVVDECLRFLKDDHCLEVMSGDVIGRVSYRFHLTDTGRARAKEAFEYCRYIGPAPVPLEQYVAQCRRQAVSGINCTSDALRMAFDTLIIPPDLLNNLGPAVCSGRSIFLYGPPGNGKSQIAKGLGRFLNEYGGEIYVPYAIQNENSIITVFDPSLHHTTDDADLQALMGDTSSAQSQQDVSRLLHENHADMRWRRTRRPVVVTGGELTLDMLDLRYNEKSNFYVAPLQVKANSGVFMIDDFGRQLATPRELLNRWILPLEERLDYVTLSTGKKFPVPFEQLVIFSTNLDPQDLMDDAFLRRIRHRIRIGAPSREQYAEIFSLCCEQRRIPFEPRAVDYLYDRFYDRGKPARSSDPRDLLEIIQAICRFRSQRLVLTQELMEEATSKFFAQV